MTKTMQFKIATMDNKANVRIGHITTLKDKAGKERKFTMHQVPVNGPWIISDYPTGLRLINTQSLSYRKARKDLIWEVEENNLIDRVEKNAVGLPIINE